MTERLYYTDSYMREFTARIVERSADGLTLYLDRTAFYPASGGQPFDTGAIAGARVVDVVDEDGRIAHRVASPIASDMSVVARPFRKYIQRRQEEFIAYIMGNMAQGGEFADRHHDEFSGPILREGDPVAMRQFLEVFRK